LTVPVIAVLMTIPRRDERRTGVERADFAV
jgi:hypothetical protein